VALDSRQAAAPGPSAVAIHDDRDVAGNGFHVWGIWLQDNGLAACWPDTNYRQFCAG
jgi:hypothetical protein